MHHKVSAIMSVYNGENYVKEAIDSMLSQTYPPHEIIVVNDGSTDRTQGILDAFGSQIVSIYQENLGLGAGRNRAIAAATGDYIAFLDHDDLWTKDKLQVQLDAINQAEDPLMFSHVQQFICPSLSSEEQDKIVVDTAILPGYIAGTLLLSKKRFDQIGLFREKKTVGEFIDWYLRAKDAKVPMKLLSHVALLRRVHQSNMGRNREQYSQKAYLHILKASLERRRSVLCN